MPPRDDSWLGTVKRDGSIDLSWQVPVDDGGATITPYVVSYEQRREQLEGIAAGPLNPIHMGLDTQEYEFEVRLPELLLMRIDRFSMANGVEARVPFLAPRLVDFVYRLPLAFKTTGATTKWAMKEAVADVVPAWASGQVKQGFATPTSRWFAERHGDLLRQLMDQLRGLRRQLM